MFPSRFWSVSVFCGLIAVSSLAVSAQGGRIAINVVTNTAVTDAILADLSRHGQVGDVIVEINAVMMRAPSRSLDAIRALPYVEAANPDAERKASPIDTVAATNFANGISMWNLDAVNVIDWQAPPPPPTPAPTPTRTVPFDGTGVYVAVLDTGLLDTWRRYFPQQRIATQFAKAFAGASEGSKAEPTNQWEHDANSHGTHVTSTILGFSLNGVPVNGVAPNATVIPVKVLGQSGSGFSSMIARGIMYVAQLRESGALGTAPVVINMSLGGPALDAVEKAAIDYAINAGVIIVAAAGNEGDEGMGYPGAYEPVISVAAAGWIGQWKAGADNNPNNWWNADDVADPTSAGDFYIADFSSRQKAKQDLDVVAPGSWVVGPYQLQSGKTSFFFLSGTSMASPHVAGIVALMLDKNAGLSAAGAEAILQNTAIPMPAGEATVAEPGGSTSLQKWGADATGHGLTSANAALAGTP
jgi:subtilisin family serine protease